MCWRLGTMLKRFFIASSFRLHISKPKKIPGNIFVDIPKVRKSSRRGLLGGKKLYFEPEKLPSAPFGQIKRIFWAGSRKVIPQEPLWPPRWGSWKGPGKRGWWLGGTTLSSQNGDVPQVKKALPIYYSHPPTHKLGLNTGGWVPILCTLSA